MDTLKVKKISAENSGTAAVPINRNKKGNHLKLWHIY